MAAKVLIIEDDKDIAELIRYHMEQDGYQASVGEGAYRALQLSQRKPPEAVTDRCEDVANVIESIALRHA